MDTLDELRAMKKKYDDAVEKNGKKILAGAFKEFFKQNPEVEKLRWTQYTPYFNDGDACTFGRNNFEVRLAGLEERFTKEQIAEMSYDGDGFAEEGDDLLPKAVSKNLKELEKDFGEEADDLFLAVFGDHVQVTATMKGFDVEEYSHD